MIAIIRNSEMYLYDSMVDFHADKSIPKNGYVTIGIVNKVFNRSSQEVIL